jgi:Ribosomal protein L7/L12 C-terminal domain
MFAVVLDFTDFVIIGAVVLLALSGLSVYLKPRDRARLARVEAKLDLLLKHAGIAYDPKVAVPPGVQDALQRGNKIEAIKLYREATGLGLAEAKEEVEAIQISLKS